LSPDWTPIAPEALPDRLADWIAALGGTTRLLIDGAECAEPEALADALIEPLRTRGRPAVHVRGTDFWRDASLRLEFGHEDVESFGTWVDADALRREVLEPAVTARCYLPTLRDPQSNRSTRAAARELEPGSVVIVSGTLLLGRDLPAERTIHLALSAAARARRTPPDRQWTLPAYDDYDRAVRPAETADVVVTLNDPRHPALQCRHPSVP
jgi:hypothetical protein